jgi:protein involved in plasmid replication-relaxation
MAQKTLDRLGRATFGHIAPRRHVRPTARETRWFKHIERHGPQPSHFLYHLTLDTHRCKDTSLRQLQKLRAGGFLTLPQQQRATERAEFKPYIYDLTKRVTDLLVDLGKKEKTIRPTGHWWHGLFTSCVTGSIDIAAARAGVAYIPAHEILAIQDSDLAIPFNHSIVIPDQLFALRYPTGVRAFALEVDRGTEPQVSTARRKSWVRSITQYRDILAHEVYKSHYGLKANLLVLYVFTSKTKQARFLQLVNTHGGPAQKSILTQVLGTHHQSFETSGIWSDLFDQPWTRALGDPVLISYG